MLRAVRSPIKEGHGRGGRDRVDHASHRLLRPARRSSPVTTRPRGPICPYARSGPESIQIPPGIRLEAEVAGNLRKSDKLSRHIDEQPRVIELAIIVDHATAKALTIDRR